MIFNWLAVAPDSVRCRAFGFFGIRSKICENRAQKWRVLYTEIVTKVYNYLI